MHPHRSTNKRNSIFKGLNLRADELEYRSKILLRLIKIKMAKYKKMQSRLLRLTEVIFLKGTMLSASGKSESVNECIHTHQQEIKLHVIGVRRNW